MPKCEVCGMDVMAKPLYRTKPKGQPDPGWRCGDCGGTPASAEVAAIVNAIDSGSSDA